MDVGDWLRNLGLPQYEDRFRENAIDSEVLLDLNEIDLEKLGAPLGHRKRILKAIAALRALSPHVEASASTAERRQLTLMFCDLVGSTALAAKLDPEDMSDVIRAFQSAVADEVGRFDGHIAK
ncbi:MAG TPA: hypothetical protein VGM05_09455, partial [Planctomycetaceae bacterium]